MSASNWAGTGPASAPSNAVTPRITTRTYYYAGSARIAMAVNGVFSYLAADGISSADVALNASRSVTASQLFAPYGGSRYSSGSMPTDYGFTGQHADSASGLDYYVSRYYDPVAGQFTSPDTVLPGNGYHIFGLSRYAYVEGNPETRNDPTGRCPFCIVAIGAIAGAVIGAGIAYGTQVVGNRQHGQSLGSALTHVDVAEIGKAALVGAVVGATGAFAASLLAGAGVSIGVSIAGSMAIGGGEGAMGQVEDNLLHGRAWHQRVAQAALFGAATGGVGAVAGLGLRQLARRFAGTLMRDGDTAMKGPISCATGAALSFSADTPVATPDGPKPIASLKAGDQVLAYDPGTKQLTAQIVEQIFVNHDSDRVDVTLETPTEAAPAIRHGSDSGATAGTAIPPARSSETIHTTAKHPWLTADRGWVDAGALHTRERVRLANGDTALVDAIRVLPGAEAMYDLSLADVHTFAVGAGTYVVHT